ncbi:MAG TPA: hypothetical protein VGZ03_11570 [Acidimicrobiales bacterium]|nr:hypothetical protein [Acidimicrobiales bacterium]
MKKLGDVLLAVLSVAALGVGVWSICGVDAAGASGPTCTANQSGGEDWAHVVTLSCTGAGTSATYQVHGEQQSNDSGPDDVSFTVMMDNNDDPTYTASGTLTSPLPDSFTATWDGSAMGNGNCVASYGAAVGGRCHDDGTYLIAVSNGGVGDGTTPLDGHAADLSTVTVTFAFVDATSYLLSSFNNFTAQAVAFAPAIIAVGTGLIGLVVTGLGVAWVFRNLRRFFGG